MSSHLNTYHIIYYKSKALALGTCGSIKGDTKMRGNRLKMRDRERQREIERDRESERDATSDNTANYITNHEMVGLKLN